MNLQPSSSDPDKTEKVVGVPPLEESFVKGSIETTNASGITCSNTSITGTTSDVTDDNHHVTNNNSDDAMRFKDGDTGTKCANLSTDMTSQTGCDLTMEGDDITDNIDYVTDKVDDVTDKVDDVTDKVDDVIQDADNVISDSNIKANDDDDIKAIDKTKTISGAKVVDDVIGDVTCDITDIIESEGKTESCDEKEKHNYSGAREQGDRLAAVRVKQDLRKIQTTVDFVDEDVRDIEGNWDLNNSVDEEEVDWELDESDDGDINENDDVDHKVDHDDENDVDDIGDHIDESNDHGNNIGDDIGCDDEIIHNVIKADKFCNETVADGSRNLVQEKKRRQSKG